MALDELMPIESEEEARWKYWVQQDALGPLSADTILWECLRKRQLNKAYFIRLKGGRTSTFFCSKENLFVKLNNADCEQRQIEESLLD